MVNKSIDGAATNSKRVDKKINKHIVASREHRLGRV